MRKVLFMTVLLAFIFTSYVWAADVSGTWAMKMQNPQGQDESFDLIIKAAGENLTITGTHPAVSEVVGTGTLKGDAITMNLKSPSVGVEFSFKGKIAGNKMSGTRDIKVVGPSGGSGGGAPDAGGAPGGAPAAGGAGGAPGGGAPAAGGAGGAPGGGAPAAGGAGGAPDAGGAPGGDGETKAASNDWTAEKK